MVSVTNSVEVSRSVRYYTGNPMKVCRGMRHYVRVVPMTNSVKMSCRVRYHTCCTIKLCRRLRNQSGIENNAANGPSRRKSYAIQVGRCMRNGVKMVSVSHNISMGCRMRH